MNATHIRIRILMALGVTGFVSAVSAAGCGGDTTTGSGQGDASADGALSADGATDSADASDAPLEATLDATPEAAADATPDVACIRRPFLVERELRACAIEVRSDWTRAIGALVEPLDTRTRDALEAAWLEDARQEHASVAAFARFTLMLLASGAPPDLVVGAQRASLDEVAHARACFALASRYGQREYGPGALSLDGALATLSLAELSALTVHEGCVGETLGVLLASEQLARARDPEVRAMLAKLVKDEQRHAELAWSFVRWAIARGGADVERAVANAFEEAERDARGQRFVDPAGIDRDAWSAHGRLGARESAALVQKGLGEIVRPCARELARRDEKTAHAIDHEVVRV